MAVSISEYMQLLEDCGAPTYEHISTTLHRAMEQHVCDCCGNIKPGDYYERTACKVDGDFTIVKRHLGYGTCVLTEIELND